MWGPIFVCPRFLEAIQISCGRPSSYAAARLPLTELSPLELLPRRRYSLQQTTYLQITRIATPIAALTRITRATSHLPEPDASIDNITCRILNKAS